MDPIMLSRIQYALTTIFHFFFVPLSIGLVLLVAIMETLYVAKGKEIYKTMAKFWGKLFLINFAVGVVTGILQEFQFGMNWSEYSRFVGDVFGAPLAIEALLAFFMESTFIGLWIFGWDRLSKKVHLACIWLVFTGTFLSALWILAANSFMQHPVGFTLNNGRAEMNDFFALITNGQLLVEFPHTIFGALMTGAFVVTGISAYKLMKKQDVEVFRRSFNIAIIIGLVSSLGVAFSGHFQAQYLVETQPMKMAASEGTWTTTEDPAPWTVIASIDTKNQENSGEIKIPGLLSYLSYSKFSGSVKGMKELNAEYQQTYGPGDYIPPVRTTFWSFRVMIAAGGLMILLAVYGTYLAWRKKLEVAKPWFMRLMVFAISLPFIANTAGWIMTEVGRQPWTVFGYMTTEAGVSPNVSAGMILFSTIAFTAAYSVLGAVMVYLFVRKIKAGPYAVDKSEEHDESADPFGMDGGGIPLLLSELWFVLIAVLFIGFFFLEGFDFGVGMSTGLIARTDRERRTLINSIGPFWDGNEVWLLTAGGAMFAAFPHWYATLFSGFYLPLVVVLLLLIGRGVAFEFRSKMKQQRWRKTWDIIILVASALLPFLFGVVFATMMKGLPIDEQMQMHAGFLDIVNPYSVVGGLSVTLLCLVHGLLFASLRTVGELRERALHLAQKLMIPLAVVLVLYAVLTYVMTDVFAVRGWALWIMVALGAVAFALAAYFIRQKREGLAFGMTGAVIAIAFASVFIGLFPRVIVSSLGSAFDLTVYNAASGAYSLKVMTIVACTLLPFVLGYQIWSYYIFRKRLNEQHHLEY